MITSIDKDDKIDHLFNSSWVNSIIGKKKEVLFKINLARLPETNHPRTDPSLLDKVIKFFLNNGYHITICESADGFLANNLHSIGFKWINQTKNIQILDLDELEYSIVETNRQKISIPSILKTDMLKISVPCSSKREGMLFSNNIKNFFGATPRAEYLQEGQVGRWRSKLHDNLTQSVLNVFKSFETYAPFDLYINGGNAYSEKTGAFLFEKVFISDNANELDQLIFERYFSNVEKPEYLLQLQRG